MRNVPEATYLEPLLGWRFWRVHRTRTLAGLLRYRLCAAGALGQPKIWRPGEATVAVCSDRSSRHEAPFPSHECGIYAYRDRDDAERKLVSMVVYEREYAKAEKDKPSTDTFALGQVQLWGRVIECELGWRGQYAYPYDVTVFSASTAARQVREDYSIDVSAASSRDVGRLIKTHAQAAIAAKDEAHDNHWYEATIYGRMDSAFLRPYHDEVMETLKRLESRLRRVERGQVKTVLTSGGEDVA
jgi:hypothetical protein